jgi:uncharacterized protein (DUF58 family)
MPRPRADALALAARHRLVVPSTLRGGLAGERLGRGTGASLEFEDRRAYVPGDDVRHLDWRAYARTDQLQVRVYREEIVPRLELLVDVSASMSVEPEKAQALVDLTAFLAESGRNAGLEVRVLKLGEQPEPTTVEELESRGFDCTARRTPLELLPAALQLVRARSLVVLVSDFLFPHAAADLVRPLLAKSGPLTLVQLLGVDDAAPPVGAAVRLEDAEEARATLDVVLDARTVARYGERLERLKGELEQECRRGGATWVSLVVGDLEVSCRRELIPRGVVTPQ